MKQYRTIGDQNGFLFERIRNTMVDDAQFVRPTMYSGCDIYGNDVLLPDAASVFRTARIQGINTLFVGYSVERQISLTR